MEARYNKDINEGLIHLRESGNSDKIVEIHDKLIQEESNPKRMLERLKVIETKRKSALRLKYWFDKYGVLYSDCMPDVLFEKEGQQFMVFFLYESENIHRSDESLIKFLNQVKLAKDVEKYCSEKLPIEFRIINLQENLDEQRRQTLIDLFKIQGRRESIKHYISKLEIVAQGEDVSRTEDIGDIIGDLHMRLPNCLMNLN